MCNLVQIKVPNSISSVYSLDDSSDDTNPQRTTSADRAHLNQNICYDSDTNIQIQLATWATGHKIPQNALNSLIRILRTVPVLSTLPNDARTLLKTPRKIVLKDVTPGKYYHFGLANELYRFFETTDIAQFLQNNTIDMC